MRSHPTKLLSTKAALFVLLAFQLIVGLPLQAAQAALDIPAPSALAANHDCPMHDAARGAAPVDGGNKHAPAGNHDCCRVSACQCHCVYTPAAFDLPPLAAMSRLALPSLSSAQFVAPRIDEFLRPPIA